jgi:hypothetical protein
MHKSANLRIIITNPPLLIYRSPDPEEKNPIKTPPEPGTPKPKTPNVSFRKGFEIPGANGTTDRVVLPYEKKSEKKVRSD